MLKIFKTSSDRKQAAPKQAADETVLSDTALAGAAGGLNPQPLPPRWR
ncbi:hypothetical protein [Methylobacterium nonmethylotrophicum]|nr:hypothetical protein [Methylobacterium nonmethylotrophicum]